MQRDCRFTLLDAYYVPQGHLERLFHRPGTCYGDLRQKLLIAQQATRASRSMARPNADMTTTEEDIFFMARLDRVNRAEWHSEYDQPHFCGGPLVKGGGSKNNNESRGHAKMNVRAKNATRHRFARPSALRQSHRQFNRLRVC
ncbi:MAG: hypothetical protein Q8L52_03870 [bacterium]|nr:hypothetical protein [bacterium]